MDGFMDVGDAARRLGVSASRIRQMLSEGQLVGERVANRWLVPVAEVARRARRQPPTGRALAPRSAWAVLRLLEGESGSQVADARPSMDHTTTTRVDGYAASPFDQLAPRLRRRAAAIPLRVEQQDLARLASNETLVRSGAYVATALGADLGDDGIFEAYLPASGLDSVLRAVHGRSERAEPNVVLHTVQDVLWPFSSGTRSTWPSIALLDLYDRSVEGFENATGLWPGVSARTSTGGRRGARRA